MIFKQGQTQNVSTITWSCMVHAFQKSINTFCTLQGGDLQFLTGFLQSHVHFLATTISFVIKKITSTLSQTAFKNVLFKKILIPLSFRVCPTIAILSSL